MKREAGGESRDVGFTECDYLSEMHYALMFGVFKMEDGMCFWRCFVLCLLHARTLRS